MSSAAPEKNASSRPFWDAIDGALVVNLDQRPERWERLRNEASGLLPPDKLTRLSAVLGRDLPGFGQAPWFRGRKTDGRWAARAGCTLSHRAILTIAREKGWKRTLVLEDDADFNLLAQNDFAELLEKINASAGDWDVCYLGYSKAVGPSLRVARSQDHDLCEVTGCYTTHAYLVNTEARDWILDRLPDESNAWAWHSLHRAIDRWYARNLFRGLRVWAVSPSLIPQHGGFSDIVQKQVDYEAEFAGSIKHITTSRLSFTLSRALFRLTTGFSHAFDWLRSLGKRRNGF